MKEIREYEKDLSSIRSLMERSVKFISLSGISGVIAGVYALAGVAMAYSILGDARGASFEQSVRNMILTATVVLVASLATGVWFSYRKARRRSVTLWNTASRRLLVNISIPLVTGGIFIIILLMQGYYAMAAPASLVFYGLALIQGSQYTYEEIRYLGFCEIILGLFTLARPDLGMITWAIGFGVLHIIYGTVMYYRHDQ